MRANYKMQRLFVPDDLAVGIEFDAGQQQSHYLLHVLRLGEGAEILVFNGRDGEWSAAIAAKSKRAVRLKVLVPQRPQPPLFVPVAEQAFEFLRFANLWHRQYAALFGRLDDIGAQAIDAGFCHLRVLGDDRLQQGHTHLHGLLHHVIKACVLERCKQEMKIARTRLRAHARTNGQTRGPLAGSSDAGLPLAIAAVEEQHPVAPLYAQDVKKIIGLVPFEQNLGTRGQWSVDKKTGGAEVVGRHDLTDAKTAAGIRFTRSGRASRGLDQPYRFAAFPTHSGCYKPPRWRPADVI